ncbi:MAG: D-inositol-3-phosphate glycosyltransferase [Chroococcopsis gigantea SAG 12.99]|jgi:glycosyltransferase involved in cell wall biosynthesis|nr:glycosyltransferase family 4 protein [Chlorogloea purpurea SAG 13.99]MDV3000400.1 D-inositol-3-phosphate glycosyltransferase [Chroococcopsis gigantea SAG 12.99]
MHIAWLGKKSPFCGNVTYGREVTNSLLDLNYQVSFLHFASEETNPDNWPDCAEVFLPYIYRSQAYILPSLKSTKVLVEALKELKPDLVHASLTLSPLDFRLPEICESLNIPLVATFHPPFDSKIRNFKSSTQLITYQLHAPFLANYDKVIIFSNAQRDLFVKLGVPAYKLAVIPNGVDTDKYCPGESSVKTDFKADRLFVYLGRIATEKNVEALLKAWKYANLGPGCKLLIVGNGPLTTSLEPFYGEEYNILWLGSIADEEKRIQILRGADAFILPSLVEGLSISLLEAMACGTACVATDAGADGEVLEGAGIVLNTQGVTTQLKTLLPLLRDHPELTDILGKKGRQRVVEKYTLKQNINQLEIVYKQVSMRKSYPLSTYR